MKKYIALLLALLLALALGASAETNLEKEPRLIYFYQQNPDGSYKESYVLIGSGNGAKDYQDFAAELSTDYAAGYAQVWNTLEQWGTMTSVNGEFSSLAFEAAEITAPDGKTSKATRILLNGEEQMIVEGQTAFAMFAESLSETQIPEADEACDAYIWLPDGVQRSQEDGFAAVAFCTHCGNLNTDETHTTADSKYCMEGHTQCMENTGHTCASCGMNYPCAKSGSHVRCKKCGRPWCDRTAGNHTESDCGHRGCEVYINAAGHAALGCGHYTCSGGNHSAAACGVSGHTVCDGKNHVLGACGHFACDGANHTQLDCGHFACDGMNHGAAGCGSHFVCDGSAHDLLPCGHFACNTIIVNEVILPHEPANCQTEGHFKCDPDTDHSQISCRHFACSGSDHTQLPCGHFTCDGADHTQLACGHFTCDGADHAQLACGHFTCDGADHAACAL